MKANHQIGYVHIDGLNEPVEIHPGQFITGRFSLCNDFYPSQTPMKHRISPLTLWRKLQLLQNMQNLNIKSFNKYSVITINNWNRYQVIEQRLNNSRTTAEQQLNTNKNVKNDKNVKNKEYKYSKKISLPSDFYLNDQMIQYANSKGIYNNLENIFEEFKDWHLKKNSKYADWMATWRSWIRKHIEFKGKDGILRYSTKNDIEKMLE